MSNLHFISVLICDWLRAAQAEVDRLREELYREWIQHHNECQKRLALLQRSAGTVGTLCQNGGERLSDPARLGTKSWCHVDSLRPARWGRFWALPPLSNSWIIFIV